MYNSKLVEVYHKLNGPDKRGVSKLLQSPLFNRKEEVIALWTYLLKSKGGETASLQREAVFAELFPGVAFEEKYMRHLMSWLLGLIEDYLAYKQAQRRPIYRQLNLAEAYRERGLEKHFRRALAEGQQQLEKMHLDRDYLYAQYLLEFERYAFADSRQRTTTNNLQELSRRLDVFITASKLKQSCMLLAHQAVYKVDYDYSFLPQMLDYLSESNYLEEPAIAVYYHYYRAATEDSDDQFEFFRQRLLQDQEQFSRLEARDLYLLAINFCIKRLNRGETYHTRVAFQLYQEGFSRKFFGENTFLSRFTYKNVVALGLNLGEVDWVKSFVHDYRASLDPKYRESNFSYNLARVHFIQGDYDKAMQLLLYIDEKDLLLNLDAKIILLMIYYERSELEALESLLNSFQTYLSRKKVIGYHKVHYLAMVQLTRKLLNISPGDDNAKHKLKQEIEAAKILPQRPWLLAKLVAR